MAITYRGERFSGYNKPKRTPGKNKKFAVLAKKGETVRLVRFGDPNMTIKKDQPKRRKSFRARHKCKQKNDKTKAGYWSCRLPRYAKSLGLGGGGNGADNPIPGGNLRGS